MTGARRVYPPNQLPIGTCTQAEQQVGEKRAIEAARAELSRTRSSPAISRSHLSQAAANKAVHARNARCLAGSLWTVEVTSILTEFPSHQQCSCVKMVLAKHEHRGILALETAMQCSFPIGPSSQWLLPLDAANGGSETVSCSVISFPLSIFSYEYVKAGPTDREGCPDDLDIHSGHATSMAEHCSCSPAVRLRAWRLLSHWSPQPKSKLPIAGLRVGNVPVRYLPDHH